MTIDQAALDRFVFSVRPPVIAVTTHFNGRDNGLITLSGQAGSIILDAMRMSVSISKPNFSHDLVMQSGIFVLHLLATHDEVALGRSLEIVKTLGGQSGRDGDKMAGLSTRRGVTGAPILIDALSYVECRVIKTFDGDEMTIFLGDVVANEKLSKGMPLDAARLWAELPSEWREEYEAKHDEKLVSKARVLRRLK